ncbi:MAG: tetratricopeptide repeat protein [Acidobacteriota bacterium]
MFASRPLCRLHPLIAVILLAAGGILVMSASPTMAQAGRLAGQVVDQDGDPVAGVTVRLQNEDRAIDVEVVTDDDGRFSRTGLEPGLSYRLTIDAEGYLPVRQEIRLDEGGSEVQIELQGGRAFAEARYQEGYGAYEQQDFASAAAAMDDVTSALQDSDEPDDLYRDALVLLGYSRGQLGETEEAEAAYQELVEAAPEDSRGYFGLGGIDANRGDIEAAIENFERAVELAPDDTRSRYALGAMYVEAERWEEAIPPLEAVRDAESVPPIVHLWLGNAYANAEQREAAIDALETYLELAPDAPEREQVEDFLEALREGDTGDGDDQGSQPR